MAAVKTRYCQFQMLYFLQMYTVEDKLFANNKLFVRDKGGKG